MTKLFLTDRYKFWVHGTYHMSLQVNRSEFFLTTISAPPCSLSFTDSVWIANFRLSWKHLLSTLYIDWHNCILHYNDHFITLHQKAQPSHFNQIYWLLFSRPGPYNIQTSGKTYGCSIADSTCFRIGFCYSFWLTHIPIQESSQSLMPLSTNSWWSSFHDAIVRYTISIWSHSDWINFHNVNNLS